MMASTHVAFGVALWTGYSRAIGAPFEPESLMLVGLASLLPDIDHPSSSFGRVVPFISYPFSAIFGHRGITHSILAIVGGIIALWFYGYKLWFVAPLVVGYMSHLIGDMFTNSGVLLFWPAKQKICFPLFNTGGITEFFVRLGIVAFVLWLGYGWLVAPK